MDGQSEATLVKPIEHRWIADVPFANAIRAVRTLSDSPHEEQVGTSECGRDGKATSNAGDLVNLPPANDVVQHLAAIQKTLAGAEGQSPDRGEDQVVAKICVEGSAVKKWESRITQADCHARILRVGIRGGKRQTTVEPLGRFELE